jgi:hypothetical protein
MILNIHVHPSWFAHPEALGRILERISALETAAPWSPPTIREPGQDDDLAELLNGMEPAICPATPASRPIATNAPAPTVPTATKPFDGIPGTGQGLYRWACDAKMLPKVNAAGKARGYHRLVTHWDADQVAVIYRLLTGTPAAAVNGRSH